MKIDNVVKENCDGHDLRSMIIMATHALELNCELVNALNVFPVPDGDTGTNMLLTMKTTIEKSALILTTRADVMAESIAKSTLFGARGNSGVILSQFFKGFAEGLKGNHTFNGADFAKALSNASTWAYKAVGKPVEGTILTVIREASIAAIKASESGYKLNKVCEFARDASKLTLSKTPTLLPVLSQAGVVDAGGQGLCFILDGFLAFLNDMSVDLKATKPEKAMISAQSNVGIVNDEFLVATEDDIYGYCINFAISGETLNADTIKACLINMADSVVVIGDQSMVKVHAHNEDPGALLTFGISLGTISQIKIDNMDEQHQVYLQSQSNTVVDELPIAVLAIGVGDGIKELFLGSGASKFLLSGDLMNPSTKEILLAIDEIHSNNIIVLPNNTNIVLAVKQASELSDKLVRIVDTNSIPQGLAATLAFNIEDNLTKNLAQMRNACNSIWSGQITRASRSAKMGKISIQAGQIIGLLEKKLLAVGDDPDKVLLELLRMCDLSEAELITIILGQESDDEKNNELKKSINEMDPDIQVELIAGGQPRYYYLISIE